MWRILSLWSLYLIKMFCFKNNMIKLTSAVFFLARMHIHENPCELISLITNRRKEYLLCNGNKYGVVCNMAIFILKLSVNTLKIFPVYWEKHSRAADILIFESSDRIVEKSYIDNSNFFIAVFFPTRKEISISVFLVCLRNPDPLIFFFNYMQDSCLA